MIHGLDIGGSKIEIAVFGVGLAVVDRWRTTTPTADYKAFLDSVCALVADADSRHGKGHAIGLGLPGLVDATGRSLCANVPCATGHTVAADLAQRLGRPVAIENDCRCFALSEAVDGAGEGHSRVFGAILGTGAAGGMVVNGVLQRGAQGIAGEYGHIQLPATLAAQWALPLWQCGCGLPACVESYVSGPGLARLGRQLGVAADSVPALAAAWRKGDEAALRTLDCFIEILGATFATVSMMVDPDILVLGGGVSLLDEVVERLPPAITRHLFAGFAPPQVARAKFGDSSGVRGAAILAQRLLA
jgi:N-acetylglucosamine kinase